MKYRVQLKLEIENRNDQDAINVHFGHFYTQSAIFRCLNEVKRTLVISWGWFQLQNQQFWLIQRAQVVEQVVEQVWARH